MKICIICSRLSYGGAERVAVAWANGFSCNGHKVMVITNLYDPITYQLDKNIEVRHLVPTNDNKIKKWLGSRGYVRRHLKEFHPNVVIGVLPTCSFVARIASVGLHIPVIATEHDSFERPESASFSFMDKVLKFLVNRIYRYVTVLTSADKRVIGNRLSHIHVMPNPLALQPLLSAPFRKQVILAAGRIDAWHYKGFDVLIRAWARVVSSLKLQILTPNPSSKDDGNYGWKLQIAGTGSGESLNYLKQICEDNGVGNSVEFLGFRNDVEKLYQDASIFVLSSRYEGFGLVLIEAMSQGCACIACDYKGRQREIMCPEGQCSKLPPSLSRAPRLRDSTASVDDLRFKVQGSNNKVELCETGILCEPDDVEALAEAMKKMIEDDEYRESVRAKTIERSKYYSIENTMDRWEALLKQVTEIKRL